MDIKHFGCFWALSGLKEGGNYNLGKLSQNLQPWITNVIINIKSNNNKIFLILFINVLDFFFLSSKGVLYDNCHTKKL